MGLLFWSLDAFVLGSGRTEPIGCRLERLTPENAAAGVTDTFHLFLSFCPIKPP